jgi:hypothetical protein
MDGYPGREKNKVRHRQKSETFSEEVTEERHAQFSFHRHLRCYFGLYGAAVSVVAIADGWSDEGDGVGILVPW